MWRKNKMKIEIELAVANGVNKEELLTEIIKVVRKAFKYSNRIKVRDYKIKGES